MEHALYFPYATITDRILLKQALLLWDKLEYIVPWEGFPPEVHEQDLLEAIQIVGEPIQPNEEVKEKTHQRVKRLLKQRLPDGSEGIPRKYLVEPDANGPHIFADKFSRETWLMLNQECGLIRGALRYHRGRGEALQYQLSRPIALAMMTILADEMAGKTARRVTDHTTASESSAALKTLQLGGDLGTLESHHQLCLVQILAPAVPLAGIPLSELVRIRASETAFLKELRINYREAVDVYINDVTAPESSRDDIRRIVGAFEDRIKGHLTELKRMLNQQNWIQGVGIGEILGMGLGGSAIGLGATLLTGGVAPLGALATAAGAGVAAVGLHQLFRLVGSIPQNREKREKLMRDNPAAWLYHVENETGTKTL